MLLTDEQLQSLRDGVMLSDGPTLPAVVRRVRDSAKQTFFEITITEGRNRQVRRMVEALDAKVLKLVRTRIGNIEIGDLEIGKYRALTPEELAALRKPSRSSRRGSGPGAPRPAGQAPRRASQNGTSRRAADASRRHGHTD